MVSVIAAVGQAEREAMLERQREGIAKAKREGRYKGRVPTARRQAIEIIRLKAEGVRPSEIAVRLGIGRASVYRVLGEQNVDGVSVKKQPDWRSASGRELKDRPGCSMIRCCRSAWVQCANEPSVLFCGLRHAGLFLQFLDRLPVGKAGEVVVVKIQHCPVTDE